MPRGPRVVAPATTYHLTARGTGGEGLFRRDGDRQHFLQLLELVVETPDMDLDRGMHRLNGCYAQSFNRRYARFGHLFAERFHSVRVSRDEHMLEVVRYVALNPVRAGVCQSPGEYEWSSYRAAIGGVRPPKFLALDRLLSVFGRDPANARLRLRRFVEEK